MNKNFEDAYKAEVQQNIPDLWNRIESSLPPKTPVADFEAYSNDKVAVVAENVNIYKQPNTKTLKKKNSYAWIKWASLAAACLLVVLMLPALAGIGALGIFIIGSTGSGDMAAAESENMAMDSADYDSGYTEEGHYEYEINLDMPTDESMDSGWENDMVMEDVAATEGETIEDSTSSVLQSESYRELLIEDMYAKVTEVTETEEGYMLVTLEVSSHSRDEADECFANIAFYDDGELQVKVYEDTGEIPVVGEMYSVTVYDCSPPWQSMIEPCEAVLELYE